MRLVANTVALAVPLIGLLTWLSLNSGGPLGQDYVFAQRDVARVSLAEAALQADVLLARAGLLRNYDPIVADMDAFREAAQELYQQAMVRPQDRKALDTIGDSVVRDEEAVERFKTDNALLQNSLSYFDVLDTQLAGFRETSTLTQTVVALGNAVFHLNRAKSPDARQLMQKELETLASEVVTGSPAGAQILKYRLLLLHGRLLARLLPAVDNDLRNILAISTFGPRQVVRGSQDERRLAEERVAARFRTALYGTSTALALLLAIIGVKWVISQQNLRRRNQAEARISAISAELSKTPREDFERALSVAVGELGLLLDADRAHLLLDGGQPDFISWSRHGNDLEIGPSRLRGVALPEDVGGVVKYSELPAGALRDALGHDNGMSGYCIRLDIDGRRTGIFVFATSSSSRRWPAIGLGLAQVAAEVLQGAILSHSSDLQRIELQARIDRSRRLETIGTFASGIAHNFNNVLGAILGNAEMAAEQSGLPVAAVRNIAEIQRAGKRAQDLVANILSFGARRPAQNQLVSVDMLLAETLALIRVIVPADVELAVEPGAPGALIRGDVAQLQQVLVNLAKNGAEAMAGAGRLTISVDLQQPRQALQLSHGRIEPGRYVRLRVADTGIGMSAGTLANIFRPFFSTKPAGTGLGLATIREIVRDHGGVLDVRTAAAQGSVFSVWLAASLPTDNVLAIAGRSSRAILLIGPDHESVVHDEEVLAALGYEPCGFHELERALDEAARAPGRFDAIIINSPGAEDNFLHLTRRLRAALPPLPVVLVVNDPSQIAIPAFAEIGLAGVLHSPLRSAEVASALEGAIPGRGSRKLLGVEAEKKK